MAAGFNFGGLGAVSGGGLTFGQKTTAPTLGISTLTPATTASAGINFGQNPTASAATGTLGAFSLSTPATTASGGIGFSHNPKATAATGTLGTFSLSTPATKTTTAGGFGFGLGGTATTTATGGLSLGAAATTTTASTGFNFGLTPATGTAATTATGLTLGTATTTAGGLTGFNFGTTTSAPTLGLGGLGAASSTAATAGNIFTKTTAAPTFTGLGGVDPKTSAAGGTSGSGSSSDGKSVKETYIPDQLVTTVDELQKYVKGEKSVREDIVRMSSKPMMRVQEDTAALKQLLSVVSNGLQRNACTLEKLKMEMTQELKSAEMAQRTKDIPPGLQYENTAPLEYFDLMMEQFEGRMLSYRQQIEMLESHLSALQQPIRQSPSEVFTLIKRQHESFIALAAQLQQVHEAIKAQKEQFATYRRIFHGDTKDIFQQQPTPAVTKPVQRRPVETAGPTPFPGVTNAAMAAMASYLNRPQHPHGPPVAGLMGTTGTGTSWLNAGGAGLGAGGSLLGGTSLLGQPGGAAQGFPSSSMFSMAAGPAGAASVSANNNSLANTLGSLNNTANASFNVSAATKQPFTLQKPPLGAKRGKR